VEEEAPAAVEEEDVDSLFRPLPGS
jgi:hypothetical protein